MNNQYLMTLQSEYLSNRQSKELYQELFKAVYDASHIIICSIIKNHRKPLHISQDQQDTMAEDATCQLMQRYQNEYWYIHKNFMSAIYSDILQVMFDKRHIDKLKYTTLDSEELACTLPDEGIATIASQYCDILRKKAIESRSLAKFLAKTMKYHSIAWIKEHMEELRGFWGQFHAQ